MASKTSKKQELHYTIPNNPTSRFVKDTTSVLFFDRGNIVELFQTTHGKTQRLVLDPATYINFCARLENNGFKQV